MSLASIQLCTIDPVDRAAGHFAVTAYSDDGKQMAIFDCSSEPDALRLRTAIREHADRLRRAADYRDRKNPSATAVLVKLRDDVVNLPINAHSATLVRDWISVAMARIDADAEQATGSAT